jgi:3-oxoacyl-[acyl-carrier protein] reductase
MMTSNEAVGARGFEGKIALVTGASRGIGRVIAQQLARAGARTAVNGRDSQRTAAAAAEINGSGGQAMAVSGDVARAEDVQAMVESIRRQWGAVDILVNNAAVDRRGALQELTVSEWDEVFGVNVRGPFLCIKAIARDMIASGSGRIINVGSWVGLRPYVRSAPYCASKAALIQLTRVAALELGRHDITVNAVCPGSTATLEKPMADDALRRRIHGDPNEFRAPIPMGRTAVPDDVAAAVCFCASAAARHVTGQVICVDGGQDLI